ncbi:hypothetical protein DFH06DRAFT_1237397, partial [Mycena polygramma]
LFSTLSSTLLQLCHRVEPLLYSVITIDDGDSPIFCAAETKSASFLHNAVRHVFLELPTKKMSEPRATLLSNCTGVTNPYFEGTLDIRFLDVLGTMPLRKLSFSAPRDVAEKRRIMHYPILRSLTHLDLYESSGPDVNASPTWEGWYALAALPALTHLCLSRQFSSNMLLHVIRESPCLVVAVLAFWGRFACGARGGDDFWIRAEAFIAGKRGKRRGEIDNNCYFLDEVDRRI